MKGKPGGDAPVQRRRGRAGEGFARALCDQRLRHLPRDVLGGGIVQIAGMIEGESQRRGLGFRPVKRRAKARCLPGGDIKQIPLITPQRIGGRAADVKIGERLLIRSGQGRGGAGQIGRRGCNECRFSLTCRLLLVVFTMFHGWPYARLVL